MSEKPKAESGRVDPQSPAPGPQSPAPDLVGFAGLVCFLAGLWFVWPPLVLLVVGALLFLLGLGAKKLGPRPSSPVPQSRNSHDS